jgi:FkbM family methyltransferase
MIRERLSLSRLASYLGSRSLQQLEARAQRAQGKGWGAETVEEETAAIRDLLGVSPGPLLIVDAGANVGSWTQAALRTFPQARVHAFEPSAVAGGQLTATVGRDPRVTIHRMALSDHDGEALLYANEPGSPIGSLTKRRLVGAEFRHEEMVPVRSLASWARSMALDRIDVLKLDVEGHELDALRGAGALLRDMRVVQFEFGGCNIDTRTFFQDFWYLFADAGFQLYRLGPGGLNPVHRYSESDEVFTTTNYFGLCRRNVG